MTKEAFLNHLYGGLDEPELKIIDVFICKLRKKLAEASPGVDGIETLYGLGYRLREGGTAVTATCRHRGAGCRYTWLRHIRVREGVVEIYDRDGRFVGRGIYNRNSQIAVRLLTEDPAQPLDETAPTEARRWGAISRASNTRRTERRRP